MFWQQEETPAQYRVPDDIFDLVFKLRGTRLDVDHAFALSTALQVYFSKALCTRVGVHGVRMAASGNGWNLPAQSEAAQPLSRRARLAIRVHRDDREEVDRIMNRTLLVGHQEVTIGSSAIRKLSTSGTLYARAICSEREQPEIDFLAEMADLLERMNIRVSRMICGRCGEIRTAEETIFTRALMVADLEPDESVALQQQGLGQARMLGCGLFVPHKGIDPVFDIQR